MIDVWIGSNWQDSVASVTKAGLRAVVSAPWYLDYISYGADWKGYYKADIQDFTGTDAQKNLVMGGEEIYKKLKQKYLFVGLLLFCQFIF